MNVRRLAFAFLVLLACSRSPDDAGIVLNIDTDLKEDRTAINRIVVTVDSSRQEWILTQYLPGSLGIKTSPGTKSVTVEGFATSVLRGRWSGAIVANKGSVVVQDVHLAYVGATPPDAGTPDARSSGWDGGAGGLDVGADARDSGVGDAPTDGRDAGGFRDGSLGEVSGRDGMGGSGGVGGSGGIGGRGGIGGGSSGRDGGEAAAPVDAPDGALPGIDAAPPMVAPLTGAFSVSSQFECLATAAAPGSVSDTLGLVHRLVVDPGAAIIGFADDAGVPGLSTLRSALPDALESRLTGWMNTFIKTAGATGVVPYDELTWLDNTVRALLLYWGLDSRLTLPVGTPGTHTPLSLRFASPTGSPFAIPVDSTASVTQGVGVAAVAAWPNGTSPTAVVTISDHFMGLPFGRYALQALNAILLAERGVPSTAKFLSNAVGCPGMASYVASQCVDLVVSTVCVGHQDDVLSVCEGGLAEGARQIESQLLSIDLKALHLQQGIATAVGVQVARPQDVAALRDGVWSATVDFGNGAEPATATFSAVAEASATPARRSP